MSLVNIEKTITLDVYDHDTTPSVIKTIQMDTGTRTVYAVIQNSRQDYDIGQNATVSLTVLRPDKTKVQITGQTFISHTGTDGTMYGAKAELSDVALAVKGNLKAQFKITSGEQELRTEIFAINNGEALDAGDGDWAGDLDGHNLDEMAQDIEDTKAAVSEMESDVSDLKSGFTKLTTATAEDVGKALIAKTVADGKVTEWKFGESGGLDDKKISALWEVVKRIGAFTGTDGESAVSAFKTAWGVYDTVNITGVSISGDLSNFTTGTTRQLTATLTPTVTSGEQYEEHTITWNSSNTAVARVDANGLVSAVSAGETRITCTVTANSGTYTDYVAATITGAQTPLYTLPQGTGNYTGDYGSLSISGNSVVYNCTHHVGNIVLNLALLPDGSYLPNNYTPNANSLFSISSGDEITIELSDISYQFSGTTDGRFNFGLMDENNNVINSAGIQPIYRLTRPEGTSVSGTIVANRDAEVHGVRAQVHTDGTGTMRFDIKIYVNGARYY